MTENKHMVLSERLMAISEFVPLGAKIADIGTDHGYLPIYLLQNARVIFAIAADIGELPLEHAKRSAAEYGAPDSLDFRLCSGLDDILPDEVDTIIIAGMGGETISAILSAAPWSKDGQHLLLLQPMTKIEYLRKWLNETGYCFENEKLVYENGGYFPVMVVRGGKSAPFGIAQIYGGALLLENHDKLLGDAIDYSIQRLERINQGLAKSQGAAQALQQKENEAIIDALMGMRGAWQRAEG